MAVRKWSVSVDEDLAERVEGRVDDRGLSGFVARAVEHELERDLLDDYLRELDASCGPVRAAMRTARQRNHPGRVPTAILVELYRGRGTDEAIDRVLSQGFAQVITTGARIARIAGHLLAGTGSGSEHAIDALVVATTIRLGGALVLTHDPEDLAKLAANHTNVTVAAI